MKNNEPTGENAVKKGQEYWSKRTGEQAKQQSNKSRILNTGA